MTFFNSCTNLDEVKKLYKQLAKENHPDKGGELVTMQAINNEYAFACAKLIRDGNLSEEETESAILSAAAYKEAIDKIINLEGIVIEVVGYWIWVTGNTFPVKNTLKEAGFFFASKKTAWYFRTAEYKVRNRQKMSLDQIKNKYGYETIESKKNKLIS